MPKADVDSDLDWRLPVFEAGKYLLAFDGAALLLLELWRRERSRLPVVGCRIPITADRLPFDGAALLLPALWRTAGGSRGVAGTRSLLLGARSVYTTTSLRTDGAMTPPQYSSEETARRGQAIYERSLRAQLEPQQQGKVVAIDVTSEAYEVAEDVLTACEKLLARLPDANIWVVRVGHPAVYHLGWHSGSRGE